jgi:hypothetical protein
MPGIQEKNLRRITMKKKMILTGVDGGKTADCTKQRYHHLAMDF